MTLIKAVETVNQKQKMTLGNKISHYFNHQLAGKTIAILGLAFKPETDDMREAPALTLIEQLSQTPTFLKLFDPIAMENAKKILQDRANITWCTDELEAATDADALVIVTEWKQFRFLDFEAIGSKMKRRVIFDGRNQYNPLDMTKKRFDYISIGQKPYAAEEGCETLPRQDDEALQLT
jgi:UDPglucose 6-dehydrogenase